MNFELLLNQNCFKEIWILAHFTTNIIDNLSCCLEDNYLLSHTLKSGALGYCLKELFQKGTW